MLYFCICLDNMLPTPGHSTGHRNLAEGTRGHLPAVRHMVAVEIQEGVHPEGIHQLKTVSMFTSMTHHGYTNAVLHVRNQVGLQTEEAHHRSQPEVGKHRQIRAQGLQRL